MDRIEWATEQMGLLCLCFAGGVGGVLALCLGYFDEDGV